MVDKTRVTSYEAFESSYERMEREHKWMSEKIHRQFEDIYMWKIRFGSLSSIAILMAGWIFVLLTKNGNHF